MALSLPCKKLLSGRHGSPWGRSSEILYKWEVELDCNSQLNSLINGSNCHFQDILPLQKLGASDGLCSLHLRSDACTAPDGISMSNGGGSKCNSLS
ncbi:hypothetical protein GBA52_015543 [Prunus armeniaca]|nr:hypothetical protein GBA52_015543 [Prunus armeniaca]